MGEACSGRGARESRHQQLEKTAKYVHILLSELRINFNQNGGDCEKINHNRFGELVCMLTSVDICATQYIGVFHIKSTLLFLHTLLIK